MKVKDIISLDLRVDGNREILDRALHMVGPFKDRDKITLEMLEKFNIQCYDKAKIGISYIFITRTEKLLYYSAMVRDSENEGTSIYGISLYEAFAKAAIFMYAQIKKQREGTA